MSFKDHFSRQSAAYSRYRPAYPEPLIECVVARAPGRRIAVDCATGNGQAAVALATHFDVVLAVDGSASQLSRARPHPRVHYAAGLAERLTLRDRSVELVVAAQAAHWFDFERFHAELIARYHRRATPRPYHEIYTLLDRDSRIAVTKLAAILRVADALDRGHMQQVRDLVLSREQGQLVITVGDVPDLTLERLAMKEKADMFEDVNGMEVVLRAGHVAPTASSHE